LNTYLGHDFSKKADFTKNPPFFFEIFSKNGLQIRKKVL